MKKGFIIAGVACLLACAVFVWLLVSEFIPKKQPVIEKNETNQEMQVPVVPSENVTEPEEKPDEPENETPEEPEETEPEEPEEVPEPYVSPIDFESLQASYPEIYAWIEIPGTEISFAVFQSRTDDGYYLWKDRDGNSTITGELFTERTYNSKTFEDPATTIYGHRMNDRTIFGMLQPYYSEKETFEKYHEIVIYTPEREFHYEVIAAAPFDNRHIMYNYDFSEEKGLNAFIDAIQSVNAIGANYSENFEVTTEDHLLILSTCLWGDNTRRYLVVSKRVDDPNS